MTINRSVRVEGVKGIVFEMEVSLGFAGVGGICGYRNISNRRDVCLQRRKVEVGKMKMSEEAVGRGDLQEDDPEEYFVAVEDDDGSDPWPEDMPTLNSICLVGTVKFAPDVRVTAIGKLSKFKLAVQRNYPAMPGTDDFQIVTFKYDAETVEKFVTQGTQVAVEGSLSGGTWEKDGESYFSQEIIASGIKILDNRGKIQRAEQQMYPESDTPEYRSQGGSGEGSTARSNTVSKADSENSVRPYISPPPIPRGSSPDDLSSKSDSRASENAWLSTGIPSNPPVSRSPSEPQNPSFGPQHAPMENLPNENFATGARGGKMPRKGFSNLKNTEWRDTSPPEENEQDERRQSSRPDYLSDNLPMQSPF